MALAEDISVQMPGAKRAGLDMDRVAKHLAIFVGLIALWEISARAGWLNPLMFPRPSAIVQSFYVIYIGTGNAWYHLYITLTEVFIGFLAGSILGISLAVVVGLNPIVRRFLQPYIIVLEATPRIAVGPLIIAALGFGFTAKIAIVMLVCFFAPFVNTLAGMVNVDRSALELFRSLRANKWQTFRKLMLPDAAPTIMAGLRLAMASALSGALVAEFISSNEGMGVLLDRYTGSLNMGSAFATLLSLTLLGFTIFKSMEWLEAKLIYWRNDDAMARISARKRVQMKGAK
ncbi:ABC transporter permease [Pelagibacterium montanilacus]|uniref:ABC transporter permease n=1 Tax=Pelagibacterium montanilacus TaxID=2185280 RepID=UPI000F8DA098|nr:ABC transporter permease [Pelagibacterium montanilacus]